MNTNQKLECAVCGFASTSQKFNHVYHRKKWDLYECPECTFQFCWPMEQAPQDFFEKNYKGFGDITVKPTLDPRHKLLLKTLPIKTGAVLDIGCGDKLLLPELRNCGFDVWGVDFNRKVIEKNSKLFKLKNLYALPIYDFALLPNLPKFDLITFFEMLEHIENPKKFILTIKKLLNNEGFVALSVPDAKIFGPREKLANSIPYHTAYWTNDTLKIFFSKNGFEIITMKKINRPDPITFLVNILIKIGVIKRTFSSSSYDDWVGNAFQIPLRGSNSLFKKITVFLLKIITFPLRETLYFLNINRPTFFIIAQLKN
ncbi:MAG: class I SAM-dependent methyltransferase [Candidatus Nealsonbacteria bacterium]